MDKFDKILGVNEPQLRHKLPHLHLTTIKADSMAKLCQVIRFPRL